MKKCRKQQNSKRVFIYRINHLLSLRERENYMINNQVHINVEFQLIAFKTVFWIRVNQNYFGFYYKIVSKFY